MQKKGIGLMLLVLGFIFSPDLLFADQEEKLTITTYYPSPYGNYRELRAQRMAIGDNYIDGAEYCWDGVCTNPIGANADLVVEGKVGIGTVNPIGTLEISSNEGVIGTRIILPATPGTRLGEIMFYEGSQYEAGFQYANSNFSEDRSNNLEFSSRRGDFTFHPGNTQQVTFKSDGKVGIGVLAPGSKLAVSGGATIGASYATNAAPSNGMIIQGKVGIGTNQTTANLSIVFPACDPVFGCPATQGDALRISDSTGSVKVAVLNNGNVGIGTWSPTAQLHTTSTLRFAAFGVGTLTSDANGNITAVSDERLKNIEGEFSRGVSSVLALNPILYKWNEKSGLETEHTYAGFSAQNVQAAIPEATGKDSRGYLTLSDRPIIAALVNAVKEQQKDIGELRAEIRQLKGK